MTKPTLSGKTPADMDHLTQTQFMSQTQVFSGDNGQNRNNNHNRNIGGNVGGNVGNNANNAIDLIGGNNNNNINNNNNNNAAIGGNGNGDPGTNLLLLKSKFDQDLDVYKFQHEEEKRFAKDIEPETRKYLWKGLCELYINSRRDPRDIESFIMDPNGGKWPTFKETEAYWKKYDMAVIMARGNRGMVQEPAKKKGRRNNNGGQEEKEQVK